MLLCGSKVLALLKRGGGTLTPEQMQAAFGIRLSLEHRDRYALLYRGEGQQRKRFSLMLYTGAFRFPVYPVLDGPRVDWSIPWLWNIVAVNETLLKPGSNVPMRQSAPSLPTAQYAQK